MSYSYSEIKDVIQAIFSFFALATATPLLIMSYSSSKIKGVIQAICSFFALATATPFDFLR